MRICTFLLLLFLLWACEEQITSKTIVTLGDSNGADDKGWVVQLGKLRPLDSIHNYSQSGNTIGFDNLGNPKLNTLKQIDRYLDELDSEKVIPDVFVVLLGTNDCKAIFRGQEDKVIDNLDDLIGHIRDHRIYRKKTQMILVSPPPFGPDSLLLAKYQGGAACIEYLLPKFRTLASKNSLDFVNVHRMLLGDFGQLSDDGVHLSEDGQRIIASEINKIIH